MTNFDSNSVRQKVTKYRIVPGSLRELEVRYLRSLYKKNYKIIDSIKVLVENPKKDGDMYYADVEEGEVSFWGFGKTLKVAIRHLRWHIIGTYEDLDEVDYNEMGPVLVATKEFLEKHIKKVI